jgi:hypothetical protein
MRNREILGFDAERAVATAADEARKLISRADL